MPEQVQNILNKITEWWKKFNTKQKALLISIVAVIIVALAILAAVVSEGSSGWREHFLSDVSGWTDLLCRCKR